MMQATSLKPLVGMRILVTRPLEQSHALTEKLQALGATTVELPTIQVAPATIAGLDEAVKNLGEYDWLIFTSIQGVRFFYERLAKQNVATDVMKRIQVAAIGPATAAALRLNGKEPNYVPAEYLSEKIVDGLGDVAGKRVLLPRADIASKKLPATLRERGALVDDVVAYRTVRPSDLTARRVNSILADGVNLAIFTSPSTVRNLAEVVGGQRLIRLLANARIACIGPVTAREAEQVGLAVHIVPEVHTIDGLLEALSDETRTV